MITVVLAVHFLLEIITVLGLFSEGLSVRLFSQKSFIYY